MIELLVDYRIVIWVVGGLMTIWLLQRLPSWRALSRRGIWGAERDYARWRLRNGVVVLVVVLALMIAALVATIQA
ncbi:MAG: hypothetical protein KDD73_07890 [Anaerolineales bacterium]|nr:hypothetical protein [Anaerolineales bacterium]MCB9127171.1 hypothetical protein [Ardenticatenales bacterium]MCB9171931.1 hypothetical protein [Ardenticatenales bacterium]